MQRPLILCLVAAVALSACGFGGSRLNPLNWFGKSREVAVAETAGPVNPLIPKGRSILARPDPVDFSVPIDQISDLVIEPTPSGAIIRATGIAARQGAFDARLVPDNADLLPDESGTLTFSYRVLYPRWSTPVGSAHSRTINEAYSISKNDLARIRTVRVEAAQNARESRRR